VHAIPDGMMTGFNDGMMTGFNAEARGTNILYTNAVDVLQSATGSSSQPPAPMATRASTGGREKPEAPLVKPQHFDGRGSLDIFLHQFEQLSDYVSWGERERRYHLGASLMGPASQVLEELPASGSTSTEVIALLQSKFGTKLQAESFQARLKEGESIQDLYRDISRLLLLAYPGENPASSERAAVDAFISASNDQLMEFEVMKMRPKTLQEAADDRAEQSGSPPASPMATDDCSVPAAGTSSTAEGGEGMAASLATPSCPRVARRRHQPKRDFTPRACV